MRPAAEILLLEAAALRPILDAADPSAFDHETICTGWSVRDVLGHCAAALTRAASGDLHSFTPDDNEVDVDRRRSWTVDEVLDELFGAYAAGAAAIEAADGALDGIGLGEWIHGGDVREALGIARPYASEGADLVPGLLAERSRVMAKTPLRVECEGQSLLFGRDEPTTGSVSTDLETLVRLCSGRNPDPSRYTLNGCDPADLLLFR